MKKSSLVISPCLSFLTFLQVNCEAPCKKTRTDVSMKVVDTGVCHHGPGGREGELANDPCYPVTAATDFITSTPYSLKSKYLIDKNL